MRQVTVYDVIYNAIELIIVICMTIYLTITLAENYNEIAETTRQYIILYMYVIAQIALHYILIVLYSISLCIIKIYNTKSLVLIIAPNVARFILFIVVNIISFESDDNSNKIKSDTVYLIMYISALEVIVTTSLLTLNILANIADNMIKNRLARREEQRRQGQEMV